MADKKNILLIGCSGQVGGELLRTLQPLGQIIAVDRSTSNKLDLQDHGAIRALVAETAPDIIINAAAYTAVDKAESDYNNAMAINGTAPGILAEEAKKRNALLVHYSTDYVFNGHHDRPYTETDTTDPRSAYGETKLAGDQAIQDINPAHLIFRTSWVYGLRGQNFLLTMQRLAEERDELRIVADQIGAPTWSRLIAEATAQVLAQLSNPRHNADPAEVSGVYNLTCGGETSWYEFAKAILAPRQRPPKVVPIKTEEYPAPAPRPPYSVLSNDKLADTFNLRLPDWDRALDLCIQNGY